MLVGQGGKAVNDERTIGDHAWRLLKSFNFDPKELRGIGIQIQKLEWSKASSTAPPGQAVLSFAKPTSRVGTSKDTQQIVTDSGSSSKRTAEDVAMVESARPKQPQEQQSSVTCRCDVSSSAKDTSIWAIPYAQ